MAKSVICDLLQIFRSSVSAVLPENLIKRTVKYNPANQQLSILDENYNLLNRNVYVVGTGKAVRNMAIEVEKILPGKMKQGIISIPEGSSIPTSNTVFYHEGAKNNLPDKNSERTTKKIKELVTALTEEDLLIVLISGGGSALLSLPKPPIALEEKTELIKKLANAGADIKQLNIVRKRISDIKGGQLAIDAQPATVVSLILSDIVGDPIDLIASGPTVENEDNPSKAKDIIKYFNLLDELPNSIKSVLNFNAEGSQFPRDNVKNHVIGSNKISIEAAVTEAKKLNYVPVYLSNTIVGNVVDVAQEYTKLTKMFCSYMNGNVNTAALKSFCQSLNVPGINFDLPDANNFPDKDLCLILGGEITVEVKGTGIGGRNQQLSLEFSKNIHDCKEELKEFDIFILSAGTDGIDGPTDAAGAIGYKDLVSEAKEQNLDVNKYLANNDSYNFYKEFRNGNFHVITGHTGTNVMDIHLILIRRFR